MSEWKHKLPSYDPPDKLWEGIRQRLEEAREAPWRPCLDELPEYDPPDAVWAGIEARLKTTQPTRRLWPWWAAGAAAASIALLMALSGLWQAPSEPAATEIVWHTETVSEDQLIAAADLAEEEALEEVLRICQEYPFLCEDPEVQQLKAELQEVAAAKRRLGAHLTPWDTEPELVRTFARLERQEAHLMRQLVAVLQ